MGAIARITLDRPEKRNALSTELIAALKAALREADADPAVRVIALTGAGKDFCSGADLSALQRIAGASTMDNVADVDELAELFLLPRRLRRPVVALVRGRALAGGCGLATACDLVVAADSASFGYPETRIGFVPAMVTAILRRNVSEKRAFDLLVRGQTISAADAERIGLINQVVPDAELAAKTRELALEIAANAPLAVQSSKRLMRMGLSEGFNDHVHHVYLQFLQLVRTNDFREGMTSFLEKRPADFKGR